MRRQRPVQVRAESERANLRPHQLRPGLPGSGYRHFAIEALQAVAQSQNQLIYLKTLVAQLADHSTALGALDGQL